MAELQSVLVRVWIGTVLGRSLGPSPIIALLLGLGGCASETPPSLELDSLDQDHAAVSLETRTVLRGQGFFTGASLNLNSKEVDIDEAFQFFVDDLALPSGAATRADSATLEIVLPAGLPEGLHDIRVVAPSGDEGTLKDALLVEEPLLHLEDSGGLEAAVRVLRYPDSVELFAVSRWSNGDFFRAEEVQWSGEGTGSTFDPSSISTRVSATTYGTYALYAQSSLFGSATTEIQSIECEVASDCGDTRCQSATSCNDGQCVVGPDDLDLDGDGFVDGSCGTGTDCDDDPAQCGADCFPGNTALDICDGGRDQDCDSVSDEDPDLIWFEDFDVDGRGSPTTAVAACDAPTNFVADGTDCDDTEFGCTTDCTDTDLDSVAVCAGDCDDSAATGGTCATNCSTFFADTDNDNFGDAAAPSALSCVAPVGFVADNTDCDDTETNCTTDCTDADGDLLFACAGDCDDSAATGGTCTTGCSTFFADTDNDNFGDAAAPSALSCVTPTGFVVDGTDCDDTEFDCTTDCTDADLDSVAVCAGDCDDSAATGASCTSDCLTFFADTDSDNFGDPTAPSAPSCVAPVGFVFDDLDCDDTEVGCTTECTDADGDLLFACAGDCDDSAATGGTCTTGCATFFADVDNDTFGDAGALSAPSCTAPGGFVSDSSDCDDNPAACGALCSPLVTESVGNLNCFDAFDNDCDTDVDADDADCENTPPIAALRISPGLGLSGSLFSGDASTTFDIEEDAVALGYQWDWDGDGVFEATGITSSHSFATPGRYRVVLRVEDNGFLVDYNTFDVLVVDAPALLDVTTAADESDPASTPASPGGTGFSLREAILFSETTAGRQSILIPDGLSMTLATPLPVIADVGGLDIVGDGSTINGSLSAATCMVSTSSGNRFYGLDIRGCFTVALQLSGDGDHVARGRYFLNLVGIHLLGVAQEVGPNVDLEFNTTGIAVENTDAVIHHSKIHGNTLTTGVSASGTSHRMRFRFNQVFGNRNGVASKGNSNQFFHNVFRGNSNLALEVAGTVVLNDFANNIMSNNGTAIDGLDASFSRLDFSLFDGNGTDCSNCTPGGNSLFAVPTFIDEASNDFRLDATSAGVDAGVDLGFDLNSEEAGLFFGVAPDMGTTESQ